MLYVATEHDQVYAFDVNTGQLLWQNNFLRSNGALLVITPVSSGDVSCNDMTPEIGITGTPVIDTSSNIMYLVTKTKERNLQLGTTTFYQTLHGLDIRTGAERTIPRRISATAHGNGTGSIGGILTFDSRVEGQRSALTIANGQIYIAFASHCDLGTYHGWLMSFNVGNMAPTAVYVDTPDGYEGGFWGGGAGPAVDASGSIYLATGNGGFDADSHGLDADDYGDSVLRMNWSTAGFTLVDYFTPWNQQTLDSNDTDLGSGGVVLLPDQPGTTYPHLLLQVGKEGTIDLINRDNMGHFHAGNDSQIVQTLPYAVGGVWGDAAFWKNNVYFGGIYDSMKAFSFDPVAQRLSGAPTSQSTQGFTYPGPTPAVSSNGASNGIVWAIQADDSGAYAVLHAFDANNLGTELYTSEQNAGRDRAGSRVKFAVPTIADGHVFVGADAQVAMYGLLH